MAVPVTLEQITLLAPGARPGYCDAFEGGARMLQEFSISDAPLRVAHFMAQLLHESGGLTREYENLNYSARRLLQVWPWRFRPHGPLDPEAYANNAPKLANEVYGGRMGNLGAAGWLHLPRARAIAADREGQLRGGDQAGTPLRPDRP
jgi:putative chitinase